MKYQVSQAALFLGRLGLPPYASEGLHVHKVAAAPTQEQRDLLHAWCPDAEVRVVSPFKYAPGVKQVSIIFPKGV